MKRRLTACALLCCLALSGCGNVVLERSYSSVEPHSATYWENDDEGTLRAESYQELVNALLLLLGSHSEGGTVRIYTEDADMVALSASACHEVQQETALGAYLLDYITYYGKQEHGYYELNVRFGYRRSEEEQQAVINATSTEALPDLLRTALEQDQERIAVRIGYFSTDRDGVRELVRLTQEESAPETAPWQVYFYPDSEEVGIVEVFLVGGEPVPAEDEPTEEGSGETPVDGETPDEGEAGLPEESPPEDGGAELPAG